MGYRFHRSVKIAPGVRLNFNKNSIGISAGVRGARVSINSNGRTTRTVGIPGTGLYYTESKGGGKSNPRKPASCMPVATESYPKASSDGIPSLWDVDQTIKKQKTEMTGWSIVLGVIAVCSLPSIPSGLILVALCVGGILWLVKSKKEKIVEYTHLREILAPVQNEIAQMRNIGNQMDSADDAAQYFVLYDQLIETAKIVKGKSPDFFQKAGSSDIEAIMRESTSENTDRIISTAYGIATKNLSDLKTRKGMESRIKRFANVFLVNDESFRILNSGKYPIILTTSTRFWRCHFRMKMAKIN